MLKALGCPIELYLFVFYETDTRDTRVNDGPLHILYIMYICICVVILSCLWSVWTRNINWYGLFSNYLTPPTQYLSI